MGRPGEERDLAAELARPERAHDDPLGSEVADDLERAPQDGEQMVGRLAFAEEDVALREHARLAADVHGDLVRGERLEQVDAVEI